MNLIFVQELCDSEALEYFCILLPTQQLSLSVARCVPGAGLLIVLITKEDAKYFFG